VIPYALAVAESSGPPDTRPPSHPGSPPPPPPPPSDSAVFDDVQAALIALVAVVANDPLFRATRPSLGQGDPPFRLRWHLGRALMAAADLAATELPARQVLPTGPPVGLGSTPSRPGLNGHPGRARGCPDGTVRPPTAMGGVRVPGHAAASDSSAAGGSGQGKAAPHAGTGAGSPLPGADSGEGGPFRLPSPPGPPEFAAAVGQPGS
jgi:hypothetical protein